MLEGYEDPMARLERRVKELEDERKKPYDLKRMPLNGLRDRLPTAWEAQATDLIAPGSIVASLLAEDAIGTAQIAPDSITSVEIADDAVGDSELGETYLVVAKNVGSFSVLVAGNQATAVYGIGYGALVAPAASLANQHGFYWDPAIGARTGKKWKWAAHIWCPANATAIARTIDIGILPITASAGGAGVLTATYNTGGVIISSGAFTPGTSSLNKQTDPTPVDAPAAGFYTPYVNMVAPVGAANCRILPSITLMAYMVDA